MKRASAYMNKELIIIVTKSGHGLYFIDPKGEIFIFKPSIQNEILGTAIKNALYKSRLIEIDELNYYTKDNMKEIKKNWENWADTLQNEFSYKNRNALFSRMNYCGLMLKEGVISISPTNHTHLEFWSGLIQESKYIHLPETTPPAELGEALREGFRRCIGRR